MNTLGPLLSTLLKNAGGLPKAVSAEMIKTHSTQFMNELLKNGWDAQSAKTVIDHFSQSLLEPGRISDRGTVQKLLDQLLHQFVKLPKSQTPGEIREFKRHTDTILKQMLGTLAGKHANANLPVAHTVYLQNQLLKSSELASIANPLREGSGALAESKEEKKESSLFGLAEHDKRRHSEKREEKKRDSKETYKEYLQILLSMKRSFQSVMSALMHFEMTHSHDQVQSLLPDLQERVKYLKKRIEECDQLLRELHITL